MLGPVKPAQNGVQQPLPGMPSCGYPTRAPNGPVRAETRTGRNAYHCGECGRYVSANTVRTHRDDDSGVVDACGLCPRCGHVDVWRDTP